MSLSAAASLLLASGVLATLVAGALWMRAWRGRVTGWTTCCGRCGFELRGLNPGGTACPECGDSLAKASLRPATSESVPWRWAAAIMMTSLGVALLWLGHPARLLNGGRSLCAWLPDSALLIAFETMPRVAMPELETRLVDGRMEGDALQAAGRAAAAIAAASPNQRPGEGGRILGRLADLRRLPPALTTELLTTCMQGVNPVAGEPRPVRAGNLFIVTTRLPNTQNAAWVNRSTLVLTIEKATLKATDGSVAELTQNATFPQRPRREFDGAAFEAPRLPGDYEGTLTVSMRQPDGPFHATGTAPFKLHVVDPSQIKVEMVPMPELASMLKSWAGGASSACDASGKLIVSMPGDIATLQREDAAIGSRVLVEQDGLQLEVGCVWIDMTAPAIELSAVAMPDALDRTRPATLRIEPDAGFALSKAASSCTVLADTVRVPLQLPPPPPPRPAPAPTAAPQG
ncbi:MAG: hypothetical protein FJ292_08000 [Planctomycetes bacterium]|nr:hypothetical protein [Planctomycetota bacterium]